MAVLDVIEPLAADISIPRLENYNKLCALNVEGATGEDRGHEKTIAHWAKIHGWGVTTRPDTEAGEDYGSSSFSESAQ